MKKNEDFGKETLLPIGSKPYIGMKTAKNKRKTKKEKENKTRTFSYKKYVIKNKID
jgi:prefoldin subunit 5